MSIILSANPVISSAELSLKSQSADFFLQNKRKPRLDVLLIGNDPASVVYTTNKKKKAESLGFESHLHTFPETTHPDVIQEFVTALNENKDVDGILIQRPLPKSFDEEKVAYWVLPEKDVDAFHPDNIGRLSLGLSCFESCTPAGIIRLLEHYQIPLKGALACVVGRSNIVGKPMHQLLLKNHATVIHCHSHTKNLKELTRQADITILAAGRARFFTADHFHKGSVVIDVGMHRDSNQKLCGDVDFEPVSKFVRAITPVPGGVGPMTIHQLMWNTLFAAKQKNAAR